MTWTGWLQIALVLALIAATALPLGLYIARILAGERSFLSPVLGPVERGFYALAGVDAKRGMDWKAYAYALHQKSAGEIIVDAGFQRVLGFVLQRGGGGGEVGLGVGLVVGVRVVDVEGREVRL